VEVRPSGGFRRLHYGKERPLRSAINKFLAPSGATGVSLWWIMDRRSREKAAGMSASPDFRSSSKVIHGLIHG
jgi:hypothetical protein